MYNSWVHTKEMDKTERLNRRSTKLANYGGQRTDKSNNGRWERGRGGEGTLRGVLEGARGYWRGDKGRGAAHQCRESRGQLDVLE